MRRANKKISLSEESLLVIINECDKDIKELKNETKMVYDEWKRKANEIGEIAVIGDKLVKLLDIRDKNIDKKLKLVVQLNTIIEQNRKHTITENDEDDISNENFKLPSNIIDEINNIVTKK